ncbi:hypothetical protein BMW23_0257 [Bodo saltans virus]|uniref:Uncharacterized protein n=1 Tax=Bodo saltans virus TaxID=2024608 RepID=A0A2H4UU20_9VIRU|nr:hypothetical protein QJ851_gp0252 [Bodo saltans virus]ATZ80315.1 hypothetical protein BMW23_0257 [Bodo saltans virus]
MELKSIDDFYSCVISDIPKIKLYDIKPTRIKDSGKKWQYFTAQFNWLDNVKNLPHDEFLSNKIKEYFGNEKGKIALQMGIGLGNSIYARRNDIDCDIEYPNDETLDEFYNGYDMVTNNVRILNYLLQ